MLYKKITKLVSLLFLLFIKIKIKSGKKIAANILETSYYKYEAKRLGVAVEIIMDDVIRLEKGGSVFNIWRSGTDLDGLGTLHLAGDKVHCYSVLKNNGIPVPQHAILARGDYRGVMAFMKKIDKPVVIKPARDTGDGAGIFIKPVGFLTIVFASFFAGAFGKEIIVEEYVTGDNYRLLYLDGRFLSATARMPCTIIGNGVHTLRQLIEKENRNRLKVGNILPFDPKTRPILYEIAIDSELEKTIEKQGHTLNSVVAVGAEVKTQDICHWLYGGQYVDVTDRISEKLVEIGRKAANKLGIKLAGVDLITKEIDDPKPGTYVINEVNTTPGLLVHYEVSNQEMRQPVVKEVLAALFDIDNA
ncbi:hypothetical protein QUF76_00485 [Desulfobacterales bacterium HSG16]|nr:hypothetical protein [Desulfobacterales bacterium HSG16]